MENKLVALVFVALLVALGGGYGLGYVVSQSNDETQYIWEELGKLHACMQFFC